MWGGVTPLYWAMFAPAYLNAAPGAAAAAAASPALRAFSAVRPPAWAPARLGGRKRGGVQAARC